MKAIEQVCSQLNADDRFYMSQSQMNESTPKDVVDKDIVDRNTAADRIAFILAQTKPSSEDMGRSEDEIMQDTIAAIAEARKERRNPQT